MLGVRGPLSLLEGVLLRRENTSDERPFDRMPLYLLQRINGLGAN